MLSRLTKFCRPAAVIASLSMVSVPALLAGCSSTSSTTPSTPAMTVAQAVSIAQNALVGLQQEFSIVSTSLSPAQAATVAQINTDLGLAANVLKPLSTTMAANAAATGLQQAEQDFNAVVTAVSLAPLPPPYNTAVAALALSLPLIEGFVNTYVPTAGASLADAASRQRVISAADNTAAQTMAAHWQGK